MTSYLPYIVSVICAIISGFVTYAVARRQIKAEIQKIEKQHELNLEAERQKFAMEKEKMELEKQYQLELLQAQTGNQIGAEMLSEMAKQYIKSPAGQAQMKKAINSKNVNRPAKR
ncbi:MAG: hypothetical protein ACLTOU_09630 [Acutalibacter sp.]